MGCNSSRFGGSSSIKDQVESGKTMMRRRGKLIFDPLISSMGCHSSRFDGSSSINDQVESVKTMMRRRGKLILSDDEARRLIEQLESMGISIPDVKKVIFDANYDKVVQGALKILSSYDLCEMKFELKLHIIRAIISLFAGESKSNSNNTKNKNNKSKKRKRLNKKNSKLEAKLEEFKFADDPFAEFDLEELKSSYDELQTIMSGLAQKKHDAHERLRSTKRRRMAWSVSYTVVFDLVLGISVLLAVVIGHPVAISMASAGAAAIKSLEPWFNSWWEEREKMLEGEVEAAEAMHKVGLEMNEMESIRLLAEKLKVDLSSVSDRVDFALRGDKEAVKIAMGDLNSKVVEMEAGIKTLKDKVSHVVELKEDASRVFKIILR